jgi:hypothetical protein
MDFGHTKQFSLVVNQFSELKKIRAQKVILGRIAGRERTKIKFLSQNAGSVAIISLLKAMCKGIIKNKDVQSNGR